jgi:hypothetical protein
MCYLCLYGSNFNEFKNRISFWNGKSYTCIACQNFLVICEGRYTKTFSVLLFILFALHYYFIFVLYFVLCFAVFLCFIALCITCFAIYFCMLDIYVYCMLLCNIYICRFKSSLRAYVILFVSCRL